MDGNLHRNARYRCDIVHYRVLMDIEHMNSRPYQLGDTSLGGPHHSPAGWVHQVGTTLGGAPSRIRVSRQGQPISSTCPECSGEASSLTFSPQADCFAVTTATGITIYDSATLEERVSLPVVGTLAASFSRQGTFLVTQNRPAKGVENDKNLRVWRVADGELLLGLHQKNFSREEWPSIQFGSEDKFAFHRVTNNIHAYDCATFKGGSISFCLSGGRLLPLRGAVRQNPGNLVLLALLPLYHTRVKVHRNSIVVRLADSVGVAYKVNIAGVGSFAPCPIDRQGAKVAAYCPEAKGKPASAGVYAADPGSSGAMICRKSFFRVRADDRE